MKRIFFAIVLSLALGLAGCNSATPAAKDTPVPTAEKVFPTGKFVSADDEFTGYYFNADKTWSYFTYGEVGAEGKYSVKGNQWIEEGTEECPFPGTYEWTFDGSKLAFKLVGEDKCDPRREATDGKAFVLVTEADIPAKEIALPEIKIDAADFSYVAPETISEGWTRVTLTNTGKEPHHVQFLRLNDGVTFEQFQAALKEGEGPALALVKQMGGVGAVAPTLSAEAILNLTAGDYVILCFVPSPSDHLPHLAKGMIKPIKVEAAKGDVAKEPTADLTVRMKDFMYDLPDELSAGKIMIKVVNDGPEPHELNFLRLEEGKTLEDVMKFFSDPQGPPPFTPVGGMNGLNKGMTGYVEFDFQPGTYVAICNIPSPNAEGRPHFTLGMIKAIVVK